MSNLNCINTSENSGVFRHRLSEKEAKTLYREIPRPMSEMAAVNNAEAIALCMREYLSNHSWNMLKRFEQDTTLDILEI